jgi:hypothetical protein
MTRNQALRLSSPSFTQALAACPGVLAFLLAAKPAEGTVSGRDGMLVALSDVLATLTPPSDGPTAVSGAPTNKAVLRALGPSTALRDGAQQDAGEALEELCNAAVEESTAIFTRDRLPALRVVGAAREILDEGDDASRRCATDELLREWRRYASCPLQVSSRAVCFPRHLLYIVLFGQFKICRVPHQCRCRFWKSFVSCDKQSFYFLF